LIEWHSTGRKEPVKVSFIKLVDGSDDSGGGTGRHGGRRGTRHGEHRVNSEFE